METISIDEARRMVLGAQGFDRPRPAGRVGPVKLRASIERIGVLQLDSVNVLCRSHYLPLFSRLGAYSRSTLDRMAWGKPRELFEYWGHQASLLPLSLHRMLRWRMNAARDWVWDGWTSPTRPGTPPADWASTWDSRIHAPWAVIAGMTRLAVERPRIVDEVLAELRRRGPMIADEVAPAVARRARADPDPDPSTGRMWNWQDGKIAVEWLFCTGAVTTATRRNFTRVYDLSERVLPSETLALPTPSEDEARRELMRRTARALAVGTEKQLRNYFQLPRQLARESIAELVDAGELIKVRVEGLNGVRYRWRDADPAAELPARALLSPFDSLIWDRDRIEQLFGFRYRISIYTKESERTDGYYVLPFLLHDTFAARVDLRADREKSILVVPTVNAEPETDPVEVAHELAAELRLLAEWLELERITVGRRGNLAARLTRELARSPRPGEDR
jgi:uncharacterized protein YcaQ